MSPEPRGSPNGSPLRTTSARMSAMLMGGALLGKMLGLIREILMARLLGASLVADSFRGSITAIFMPIAPMQSEGVPGVLVPMSREWNASAEAPRRLAALMVALTLIATALMLAVMTLGAWWVALLVGGFNADAERQTLEFVRVMALAMPGSVLLNCLAAGEIAVGRSRIASLRSPLLNAAVIGGLALYGLTGKLMFLPWSFAIAFNGMAIWAVWTHRREGLLDFRGLTARAVHQTGAAFLKRLRPLLIQPVFEQGQVWIERLVASGLGTGFIASVDYARTLTDSAILLVSQPLGLAVLYKGSDADDADAQMEAIARPLLVLAIPASIFLAVFAEDIVRLVFARGAFDERAVVLTSGVVRGIAAGLWAATLGWVLIRILNNRGQNARATLIQAGAFGVNTLLNVATPALVPLHQAALALGLGEAARGIVLLAATAVAIGCVRRLAHILLLCLPAAVVMLAATMAVQHEITSPLARLGAGVAAYAMAVALGAVILLPLQSRAILGRIAAGRRRPGE